MEFRLVTTEKKDIEKIYTLRMDDEVRGVSICQTKKSFDEFSSEFYDKFFLIKELPPLFIVHESAEIAFVSFRPYYRDSEAHMRSCEISIIVSKDKRGQGYGTQIIQKVSSWVERQGFDQIIAYILPHNRASKKIFSKSGFEYVAIEAQRFCITSSSDNKPVPCEYWRKVLNNCIAMNPTIDIIAEIGSNFRVGSKKTDLKLAKTLIKKAKEAGATIVKFQTFTAKNLYVPNAGQSDYLQENAIQKDIYSLIDELSMPKEYIAELAAYAAECNVEFMSSVFSKEDFLAIDPYVKRHKNASYEITHIRLLELFAKSHKPLIMSTGCSTIQDIRIALDTFYKHGGKNVWLMQCTAQYPANPCAMNLSAIPWLKKHFRVPIGLSDHSKDPYIAPVIAAALGAQIFEKHITLSRDLPGPDHAFAITPDELHTMIEVIQTARKMGGFEVKYVHENEQELFTFAQRAVQAVLPIHKGDYFKEDVNISILRPGKQKKGVHPIHISTIEGKQATREINLGEGVQDGDWC